MRIIAGERRGIPLKSLKGESTRPTSDKVKEAMFNIIGPFFNGGIVVELFGGSGGLSLEALSRGADEAYIFEKNRTACEMIRSNSEKCHYEDLVHIHQTDARNAMKVLSNIGRKIDYLFLDPPYAQEKFYALAQQAVDHELLSEGATIICEHDKSVKLPQSYGEFELKKANVYGNIAISIYEKRGL